MPSGWERESELAEGAEGGDLLLKAAHFEFFPPKRGAQICAFFKGRHIRLAHMGRGRWWFRALSSEWRKEFQPEAETGPVPYYGGNASAAGRQEFQIHQISGLERDPDVKGHSPFAHLDTAALHCEFGIAAARKYANG